jgi:hypothetical protein
MREAEKVRADKQRNLLHKRKKEPALNKDRD